MSSIDTSLMEVRRPRWPMVIGVVSVIYALGGMLCQVGMAVWSVFAEALMQMGGIEANVPTSVQVTTLGLAGLTFFLGLYMLAGAIALMRRSRSGPRMLRRWAMMRMALLLLGVVISLATAPAMVQFQRQVVVSQNDQYRAAGMEQHVQPVPNDEQLHQKTMMQTAIMTGIWALYPLFLGYYLTRRRIVDQVDQWE